MARIPARLHVLLARDAKTGVVFRRGPSSEVCTLHWDRETDQFHLGQWLRGRIYERRSDLSPDGKHLIYFAMNGKWKSETRGAWTALSRAPYLKATTLLSKGDCWHGGGLFTGNQTYWLNGECDHEVLLDDGRLRLDTSFHPSENYGGECPGVYYLRLQRDGWKHRGQGVFEKALPEGWLLRKRAHAEPPTRPGRGCYWDEHELVHLCTNFQQPVGWEWAELDGQRLVWTANGQLWAGHLCESGVGDRKCLYDFDKMSFERVQAPY